MQHRLITTSIPYMNAGPHLGFAMEIIIADVLTRYNRAQGNNVFLLTGADEHGSKIYNKAKELGKTTIQMLDEHVALFKELEDSLSVTPDDFIRTTDKVRHWPTAQSIWQKLEAKGDIYKKKYSGLYCEGCEVFMPEKDLDPEGNCPIHHKKPTLLEEENYFFRLSKYEEQLKKLIASDTVKIIPEFRKNEILSFLSEGLNDVSFSRSADKMPWGVPVPGDETQVMYVWCDALTNYLSGIGYSFDQEKFARYYPTYLHVIGKDISRFHAIIYMAMLLSADMETSKNILVHGFVTSNGEKMSKSLGNVVVPEDVISVYGSDALRYFITVGGGGVGEDIDYTQTGFHNLYNSGLVNGLGNIANRTSTLFCKYYPDGVSTDAFVLDAEIHVAIISAYTLYTSSLETFDLRTGYTAVSTLIDLANKYFDEQKPWTIKDDPEKLRGILLNLVEILYHVTILVAPFLPETAEKMREIFSLTDSKLGDFSSDAEFRLTTENKALKLLTVPLLFEKIV
ncbi:MAG: methionine--tRNA ligase [Candidatus Gracilibacteria bacterium]|nr:methionine--tRNA ligase [Candidatus Gracilibacteria bacterium]